MTGASAAVRPDERRRQRRDAADAARQRGRFRRAVRSRAKRAGLARQGARLRSCAMERDGRPRLGRYPRAGGLWRCGARRRRRRGAADRNRTRPWAPSLCRRWRFLPRGPSWKGASRPPARRCCRVCATAARILVAAFADKAGQISASEVSAQAHAAAGAVTLSGTKLYVSRRGGGRRFHRRRARDRRRRPVPRRA